MGTTEVVEIVIILGAALLFTVGFNWIVSGLDGKRKRKR
jgi:hypothetical protein